MNTEIASVTNRSDKEHYRAAAALVERAIVTSDKVLASRLLAEALLHAKECSLHKDTDAEFKYLVGYIQYKMPNKTPELWRDSESSLRRAMELNPAHQFAKYYLGCLLFDLRRYAEALSVFREIEVHAFDSIDQKWRLEKTQEISLCCEMYLDPMITPIPSVGDF